MEPYQNGQPSHSESIDTSSIDQAGPSDTKGFAPMKRRYAQEEEEGSPEAKKGRISFENHPTFTSPDSETMNSAPESDPIDSENSSPGSGVVKPQNIGPSTSSSRPSKSIFGPYSSAFIPFPSNSDSIFAPVENHLEPCASESPIDNSDHSETSNVKIEPNQVDEQMDEEPMDRDMESAVEETGNTEINKEAPNSGVMKRLIKRSESMDSSSKLTIMRRFRRSESNISITEIEKYANKKIEGFNNEDAQKLLDGRYVFNEIDKSTNFSLISSILSNESCSKNAQRQKFVEILKKLSLVRFRGSEDIMKIPIFDEDGYIVAGESIGEVANELVKFDIFVCEKMEEVNVFLTKLKKTKNKKNKNRHLLIETYKDIMTAWASFFEDFLQKVRRHLFNPRSIYHVEKTKNIVAFKDSINDRKLECSIIFNQIFDLSVLERQLKEIHDLPKTTGKKSISNTCKALSALAIERVRPSPEIVEIVTRRKWMKRLEVCDDSVSLIKLSLDDLYPEESTDFEKTMVNDHFDPSILKRSMINRDNDAFVALYKGLLSQINELKCSFVKGYHCQIDKSMWLFYENQLGLNLWKLMKCQLMLTKEDLENTTDITKSLLISSCASFFSPIYDIRFCVNKLDAVYDSLNPLAPPMIQPPNNGFTIFSSEKVWTLAVFGENRAPVVKDRRHRPHKYYYLGCEEEECEWERRIQGPRGQGQFHVMVSKLTGKIYVQILGDDNKPKSNFFHLTTIPTYIGCDGVNWDGLSIWFFAPNFNFIWGEKEFRLGEVVDWPWLYTYYLYTASKKTAATCISRIAKFGTLKYGSGFCKLGRL